MRETAPVATENPDQGIKRALLRSITVVDINWDFRFASPISARIVSVPEGCVPESIEHVNAG
jgi:hypothetical protein